MENFEKNQKLKAHKKIENFMKWKLKVVSSAFVLLFIYEQVKRYCMFINCKLCLLDCGLKIRSYFNDKNFCVTDFCLKLVKIWRVLVLPSKIETQDMPLQTRKLLSLYTRLTTKRVVQQLFS